MGTDTGTPIPEDSSPLPPDSPQLRASDAERQQIAERLGEHAAAGRISLGGLEDRVGQAYAATTRAELAKLTTDLPESAQQPSDPAATRPRKRTRWFFAVMGGSTWRGRRRLSGRVNIISVMGGDDLDLREAEIEGSELVITAVSILGGATIYVPDTLDVEFSGPAIMGGNQERGSQRAPRSGAPLIRIRTFSLMGGVEVWRLPAEARGKSLKEARRAAKALGRSDG